MPARHRAPAPTVPNDAMLRIGIPLFTVGLIAVLLDVVPFLFGAHDRPLWINVVAVLALPTGLALALFGLMRSAMTGPVEISTPDAAGDAAADASPARSQRSGSERRGVARGRHARTWP
ncbi:MAG: hypothetical protein ACXV3F_04680 [Frankiaceae bacterium]